MRSLTLERGLNDSSLANTVAFRPSVILFSCTNGVLPMVLVISLNILLILFLLTYVHTFFNACSISAIMSSTFSMPIDSRTKSGVTPVANCSSGDNC